MNWISPYAAGNAAHFQPFGGNGQHQENDPQDEAMHRQPASQNRLPTSSATHRPACCRYGAR
jgi:hypothetical protein